MNLSEFFSGLGKSLAKAAKYILKRIPDSQIDIAIGIVKIAAGKFVDNGLRRDWAIAQLQRELNVPEAIARWLVETAVLHLKAETEELLEKAGDHVKKHND